jgi:predicted nucleotidyltransferase
MTVDNNLITVKKIIFEELHSAGFKPFKILLFGSRSRNDFKKNSDYDLYVIVDKEIDFKLKK